jgi:pyrroline-5-carboxylate reductase
MGGALLAGWLEQGLAADQMMVVDPTPGRTAGINQIAAIEALPRSFSPEVVLLAVKPQLMEAVLPAYRRFAGDAVFLSIAAGRTLRSLAGLLGETAAIVRAMPNTPAAVRRGVSVLLANDHVDAVQRDLCRRLLQAVGSVDWIDHEAEIDAVTAMSGSGPAYVFLMVEAMAAAGEALGLAPDLALRLARGTVVGAGELLHQSPLPAATLRRNVTSPNGTTAAALQVLTTPPGLPDLMTRAMAAAARRAAELAG